MANHDLPPNIGVLAEHFPGERRVALVPADVRRLTKLATVTVERGAGAEAGNRDDAYIDAGATTVDRLAIVSSARVILGVRAPSDLSSFRPGTLVVSLGGRDEDVVRTVSARELKHLGLERLPRTARAQAMDVLSSQATIAGYAAVIEGARELDVLLPMLTTAAGGVKPAKMNRPRRRSRGLAGDRHGPPARGSRPRMHEEYAPQLAKSHARYRGLQCRAKEAWLVDRTAAATNEVICVDL